MTTFKRLDLFMQTMTSFVSTCKDIDLFDNFLIGDDGSSERDLEIMKKEFPELEIYKNPRIGQASNINNLFSKVKTEWFFHCEDDWLFIKEDNYIRKLMSIVLSNKKVRNATLRYWEGGEYLKTIDGMYYNLHRYNPKLEKELMYKSDSCWCGYTLNPGIQHRNTIFKLGKYDESKENIGKRSWDRPQAIKYYELGYRRANLLDKYIEHIGDGSKSAYNFR